jgi:hypothetical protein
VASRIKASAREIDRLKAFGINPTLALIPRLGLGLGLRLESVYYRARVSVRVRVRG